MRILFVTNICPHYRIKAFELLSTLHPVRFRFFSAAGQQKYWERRNALTPGEFDGGYVRSWGWGWFRVVPALYLELLQSHYDVLIKCINGRIPLLLSFFIAGTRKKPFILWTGLWHHPQTLFHRMTFPIVRHIYCNADAVVVYGEHTASYLVGLGVERHRIFHAWQAVDNALHSREVSDEELMKVRQEANCKERKIILYVGRIEEQKGLEYLISVLPGVMKQCNAAFIAVGTGSLTSDMEHQLLNAGVSDFHFIGYVPNDRLAAYYRAASVLVLPSVTTNDFKEPWGLVVNEAMNQACPVIATDSVGAAMGGLIQHGKNGLVVPERNPAALGKALVQILQNESLHQSLSDNAKAEVSVWTCQRMVSGFDAAIRFVSRDIK